MARARMLCGCRAPAFAPPLPNPARWRAPSLLPGRPHRPGSPARPDLHPL